MENRVVGSGKVLVVLPTLGDRLDLLAITLKTIEAQRATVDLTLAVAIPPKATEPKRAPSASRARRSSHRTSTVPMPSAGLWHPSWRWPYSCVVPYSRSMAGMQ